MPVSEYPVVQDLTFQVYDPQGILVPAVDYAWTGTANASTSTYAVGGTVQRTNLAIDPEAASGSTWSGRWFGSGGSGSQSYVSNTADTPSVGIKSFTRKTWSAAPGGNGDTGFNTSQTPLATSPGAVFTGSGWLRTSASGKVGGARLVAVDSGGNFLASFGGNGTTFTANTWTRTSITATMPAKTASVWFYLDIAGGPAWAAGDTLDGTGALFETGSTVGAFFDGNTADIPAVRGAWRDLAPKATSVKIKRGGQQNGASTAMQTGSLDATLFGALDLANDTALRPNAPIRVIRPGTAAVKLWDLMTGAGSWALWPRVQQTPGGFGTANNPDALTVGYSDSASGTIAMAAGSLLMGTSTARTDVPANPKPSGSFDPLTTYVLKGQAIDVNASNSRMALVVYTGSPLNPRIIAQGAPRAVDTSGNWSSFPTLKFKAPDADWQVGVIAVEGMNVTGLPTSSANQYQQFGIGYVTVSTDDAPIPEFTGAIADLAQSVSLADSGKQVFTTVSAVDGIASLANTDRYGAISASGAGYQSWEDRIAQLASSSLVPVNLPGTSDYALAASVDALWGGTSRAAYSGGTITNAFPTRSSLATTYARNSSNTAALTFTPLVYREFRTLTPGSTYTFSVTFAASGANASGMVDAQAVVMGGNNAVLVASDPYVMPDATGTSLTVGISFTATSAVARLGFQAVTPVTFASGSGTRNLIISTTDTVLTRIGDPRGYFLQDVAYQSNLASHFDLACQSVGAYWWADRDNTVVFARSLPSTSRVTFSDAAGSDISYTAVSPGFDTRNVVNSLKMNQHGYDQSSGNARDYSLTYTADSSIRRWGIRSDEIDTSIYTGPGHEADLQRRAQEIMSDLSRPAFQVKGLTFNVRSNKAVMDRVDLHRMVTVIYEGRPQRCRVIAITENITPTRWTVDLDFSDITAGATYADYTAAYTGTYSDFNSKWSGKTFNDFNANPLA